VKLDAFVKAGAPIDPGLLGVAVSVPATIPAVIAPALPPSANDADAGAPAPDAGAAGPDAGAAIGPEPPKVSPEAGGCAGCRIGADGDEAALGLFAAGIAAVFAFVRRRART
jgi:MYXO-CTERM domain-containing protein